jgi:transglutaminase superfamily protein
VLRIFRGLANLIGYVIRRVWRLRLLTIREVRLLAEAQVMLLYCQSLRWRRPMGQLLSAEPRQPTREAARSELQEAAGLGWAVSRAARYGVFRPRCLVRSLALQRLLDRRGIPGVELKIGVRLEQGSFSAHAWVEVNGRILGDSAHLVRSFTPTTDLHLVQL